MIDWRPLEAELDLISPDDPLPLWWRDDDAIASTPALDRLIAQSGAVGLPVHLAVIPAHADRSLATRLSETACLIPVVHGWAHANHAPAGQKKAEFGAHRPIEQMQREAAMGALA